MKLQHEVYDFCVAYANNPTRGYRLVIHGNNGSGKSHTSRAVVNWACRNAINMPLVLSDDNLSCRLSTAEFHNWPQFVDTLKSGKWDMVEEMMHVNLLALDDIGAEHDPSKMGVEKLYLLLERRERNWTILTTNVRPEEWENRFERRISSRLLRNSRIVALDEVPDFMA